MAQVISVTLNGTPRCWDFILCWEAGPFCEVTKWDLEWMIALDLVKKGEVMTLQSGALIWPPWYGHGLRRLLRVDRWGIEFGGKQFTVKEYTRVVQSRGDTGLDQPGWRALDHDGGRVSSLRSLRDVDASGVLEEFRK